MSSQTPDDRYFPESDPAYEMLKHMVDEALATDKSEIRIPTNLDSTPESKEFFGSVDAYVSAEDNVARMKQIFNELDNTSLSTDERYALLMESEGLFDETSESIEYLESNRKEIAPIEIDSILEAINEDNAELESQGESIISVSSLESVIDQAFADESEGKHDAMLKEELKDLLSDHLDS